ncbi:heparinase II/III family protein [Sphingomonas cannabina]|uniref:heparinase II/III family protein n=1 Tax=Sphingomonas cannabina TaxID=2899123 RepID=UPI001F21F7F6|nr:heparinase II/III family protein [Sphingomonas cannabina]UIJ45755.1 heparinase II/III family protein [Sphingomonas cannabina]
MSADDPTRPGPDTIDQGRRLIRVGGDKGLSLADRIADRFQRLAWRTPFHRLALSGRHPLRLLAVADDPFLGDPARGHALLKAMVMFRGERRSVDTLDLARPDVSTDFAAYLHGFGWLRDLSTVATRDQAVPIAEALTRRWLAAHAEKVSDPAWRADLVGRRVLAWIAHAPLILSSNDLVYRSSVLHTLARGVRHAERTADRVPPGPARIAAWCGVVAAGLMIAGGETRRAVGEAGLARALAASITGDGGTLGRSPAGQLDALMLLVALREVYAARRVEPLAEMTGAIAALVPPLLGLCHGDRGLASWQGSGPIAGDTIEAIVTASGVRTRPLKQAREWGYQRLSAQSTLLIVDAAPPPVARVAEGGCASTLAFELSDGPHRIIVNCGGGRIANATLPAALIEGLRTTAAHSTLVLADSNSTAVLPDGALGKGVAEVELARAESDTVSRIEASHDGYVRRFGFVHRRTLALSGDGRDLRGEDMLVPAGRKRATAATPFAIRFHLAPHVEAAMTADGQAALLRLPGNLLWQFRCRGAGLALEESVWIDGDGRPHPTQQLVVNGETPAGGTSVSWWFHRSK